MPVMGRDNSPESSRTRMRANRSGYSASTFPGTFIVMEALKKSEIFCSTRLSNVELHALATLAVRGAGFRDTGAKLGVAQSGQHGGQRGDEEAEDDSRTCFFPGDLASEDVDAGAECGAHPQGDEVQRGQAAGESGLLARQVQRPAAQQDSAKVGQLGGHICRRSVWALD
ncbi:hypothetical protein EYF80_025488 [Liparis tanakae]|uniref:Uncharacterized protein n=1 Tax=Liparis tanakae TaxID=230148 RepID=A0A4Z2HED1_9TELE|nr:hypothetical protein EYF80_025488 [Liparis tanakae]